MHLRQLIAVIALAAWGLSSVLSSSSAQEIRPTGGSIAITDGVTTVNPAKVLDFTSGATVTDGGGGTANVAISGGGTPGGNSGQIQYNNSGAFGGYTQSGDCSTDTSTGLITCLKSNGSLFGTAAFLNAPAGGFGTVTSIPLAPGFTTTVGTQNTGSQTISTTEGINGQLWPKTVGSSCTINTNCDGANNNSGELLIPNAASVTLTAPNPGAGTKGSSYQFGSDGTNGYSITTAGGTATFYGCTGASAGSTTLVVEPNFDLVITDDGTNYKCTAVGSQVIGYSITIGPGNSAGTFPISNFRGGRIIVGVRCTPEVLVGGTATIDFTKAASGTSLATGTGTSIATATCNANTAAFTDQSLTVQNGTLAAGNRLGVTLAGAGWGSSNPGVVLATVFVRP